MANVNTLKRPDDLLEGIGRSIMAKAIVYSIIGHFIFTIVTSVSLFRDWTIYGVKSPSAINQIRAEERRKADEEARKKKLAERAEAAKKAAETNQTAQASAATTNAQGQVTGTAAATNAPAAKVGSAQPQVGADGKIIPPEVQPLPPKKDFQYGDDLSLD